MNEIFELTRGGGNDFASYVFADQADAMRGTFNVNGYPKKWANPPIIKEPVGRTKKMHKPVSDIGWLAPGSFILTRHAYLALQNFLGQFGEFLPVLTTDNDVRYFYNATNLVDCIDFAGSEKIERAVIKPLFLATALPVAAQVFKDPLTANTRIYLNSAAKTILEKIVAEEKLTGFQVLGAGVVGGP